MPYSRRQFLKTGLALGGALAAGGAAVGLGRSRPFPGEFPSLADGWAAVRAAFDIVPDIVDMSALFIASHPRPVRDAIERHRRALDASPTEALQSRIDANGRRVVEAAAAYFGGRARDYAVTDSTTMGLALLYHGLALPPGTEFLTTDHNYYATDESLRLSSQRSGARVRRTPLHARLGTTSVDELTDNVAGAIGPATRVVALTWVHSSTGLKLPIARIAKRIAAINRDRDEADRVRLAVDGVHGFGVENETVESLGCDYFAAGCHKWLFGPRGTGILWAAPDAWPTVTPVIPTFTDDSVRAAWIEHRVPDGETTARRVTPGGFKPYEHQWAMAEAFEFQQRIGKAAIEHRTHALCDQLKQGLASMAHVRLHTPMSSRLSAGIVCFDVAGHDARQTVERLREKRIVATQTPYWPTYARLTPSIRNTPEEVERVLRAIRELA